MGGVHTPLVWLDSHDLETVGPPEHLECLGESFGHFRVLNSLVGKLWEWLQSFRWVTMLSVVLTTTLDILLMPVETAVIDVAAYIAEAVDMTTEIFLWLVDLLVAI